MHKQACMHLDGNALVDALMSPSEDTEVSSAAERPSFEQAYGESFEMVLRALRRYGVPKEQVEDALQEVFTTVHDRLSSFEGRSSVRTWVYGVARRVARNHRARDREEAFDPTQIDELEKQLDQSASQRDASERNVEKLDAARLLYNLLGQLTPERSEILILVELEQMTVAEAAEVLQENRHTLQSRLARAREDLARVYRRRVAEQTWRRQCGTKTQR
jgi:RNA polymerase sigma-70 factor (ECF subfamily)